MEIQITPFFMAGMPTVPPDPKPELPEFAFSPRRKTLSRMALCTGCDMPIHEKRGEQNHHYFGDDGPFCPVCAQKETMRRMGRTNIQFDHTPRVFYGPPVPATIRNRVIHEPETGLSAMEIGWRHLKQMIPGKVASNTKTPKGTAPTLGALGTFLDRVAEINAIAATQFLELPTVGQELAQCGISSYEIQSSSASDDDWDLDDEIAFFTKSEDRAPTEEEIADLERQLAEDMTNEEMNEAERDAKRYGVSFSTADLAPAVRRVEWERFVRSCGQVQKIWLAPKADLSGFTVRTDSVRLKPEDLIPAAKRLKAALDGRDIEALENDRIRVAHYGKIGSCLYGVYTGDHVPEQSFDILGAEDHPPLREDNGAPEELGLHNVYFGTVEPEPRPEELWPDDYPMGAIIEALSEDPDPSWLPDGF